MSVSHLLDNEDILLAASCSLFHSVFFSPVCVIQWKREQEFDLQLLERAVQGEEAQGVRSVQGEERPPEHKERPRSQSDEWLTYRSTATTPPAHKVDLEPLDYDVDLNKEVSYLLPREETQLRRSMSSINVVEGRRKNISLNQRQKSARMCNHCQKKVIFIQHTKLRS